ncbi:uncharacterized protein BDZ83DRAFT_9099 [Colletotrichum acutatum]|uniref:Secreted protein n=1 Tax=Glomerella acutata TaxID=27357 RepID=A0AAD8XR29_GLOAC|nr:uncharacterized protein BDZ83DRAFT_9099 [Colletotrichum acutatum]KAK1731896.1 hypothetical protein BDZ83DRAFT_9099 [Colletotrichum acutatum]
MQFSHCSFFALSPIFLQCVIAPKMEASFRLLCFLLLPSTDTPPLSVSLSLSHTNGNTTYPNPTQHYLVHQLNPVSGFSSLASHGPGNAMCPPIKPSGSFGHCCWPRLWLA